MDDDITLDAFSTNNLWATSSLVYNDADFTSTLFAPLELDIPAIRFDHPYAPKHDLDKELRLPDLDAFEFGPLPDLESIPESAPSVDTPALDPDQDVWEAALDLGPANKDRQFYTWDSFDAQEDIQIQTPYISERGSAVFDATLAADADADAGTLKAGRIVNGHVLLQSLWNLGLGRSSILFDFNSTSKSFEPTLPDARPTGISLRAAQSLTAQFIHLGNTVLYLRAFAERVFASANPLPARVALATSISSILSSLQDHLSTHSSTIVSLLTLQSLFERPRQTVQHLARMVDSVRHAKTNEQLASILHHRILQVEESDGHLRQLSGRILCKVAGPSLELAEEWIGIRKEQGPVAVEDRGSFVAVEDAEQTPIEYVYRSEMMPRFISPEDGNTIFETGTSLRFLKTQHPDHPLACMHKYILQPPQLEWRFEWQDIDAIAAKARDYEDALRTTVLEFTKGIRREVAPPAEVAAPEEEADLEKRFELSIAQFDAPPQSTALPDELQLLMHDILNHTDDPEDSFAPPMSITSALSFRPLITAQAKLVNAATMRLFFRSHHLRLHLSLQRQYHLFGDGVFSSLLASALFDPDRESAERHKGRMRSGVQMGLQLGSRTAWPPASSELRLALRGVLSESYYSSALYYSTQDGGAPASSTHLPGRERDTDSLPGQLNFAIRHLSEAEQEKVMDPDALCALDFLRLQYVPPPPLHLVITPAALDKYDTIFRFLLRLSRTLFVVAHLARTYRDQSARQFRIEAHHFVTTFAAYVFQSGIAEPWGAFDAFVASLSTRLDEEDAAGELGARVTQGIAALRDAHDDCLDAIMFALLLRQRQRKIIGLVDEIFEYVLEFAKMQREGGGGGMQGGGSMRSGELYAKLRGKIRVFLSVCRGLTGKKGYAYASGSKGAAAEENRLGRLVVALEMNGYFGGS
jgi:hypothetical protein